MMATAVPLLRTLALGLFLCLPIVPLMAEDQPSTRGVEAALNQFLADVGEPSAHERFWADDLIYTSSSGERFGKAEIMAGFEQSDEPADTGPTPVYSATDVQIRLENELALLTFTLVAETPGESGRTIQRYYNSGVLKNSAQDGEPPHWQALLWQATRIPEPAADTAPQYEQQ